MKYVMEKVRGKIRNREYANQVKDYSLLCWGKMTPTDIDGFLDFHNRIFVFLEVKQGSSSLSTGQRIAYENLANATDKSGIATLVLIAVHDKKNPSHYNEQGDILVDVLPIAKYFWRRKWRIPQHPETVRSAINRFLECNQLPN